MILRPPRSTRTDTLFPYTTLFRSFTGPTAVAVSADPVAAAKVCVAFAKTNEKLIIVGGAMGETKLDAQAIQSLATLPSLDELRSTLIAVVQAPATQVAARSEERRVGEECVSTCRSRWAPYK